MNFHKQFNLHKNFDVFKHRRNGIIKNIRNKFGVGNKGVLLICADFENRHHNFRQESSFYYLSGITDPAVILCCFFDGTEVLYVPFYKQCREQWVHTEIGITSSIRDLCIDKIKYQGEQVSGYTCYPFFTKERYSEIIADLELNLGGGGIIYTLMDASGYRYFYQMQLMAKFNQWLENEKITIENVSDLVHDARRTKDLSELTLISRAVDVTINAQNEVSGLIRPGKFEYEIQGFIDFSFKKNANCDPAFPSIVAAGKNTTILHSSDRWHELKNGEMVVVDIGAEYGMYSADITRTYPVGKRFSKRQREVYDVVLDTQTYIQSLVKPGMYLNNRDIPEQSLHHLAEKFLQKRGYQKYFVHGIGHFLGLDVHDVGDIKTQLKYGDVFTIEPGIYISDEDLGVRIEDDFVVTQFGCLCLSKNLVKQACDIEELMGS